MRTFLLVLAILAVAPAADAKTIVVMTDHLEDRVALQVALANRSVDIVQVLAPGGKLRLDRAATAQRAAIGAGADAAVWIDEADVCAVSSDGRYFRYAPISEISPRMFATIATSLLDELLAPPEVTVDVNVHVNVMPSPTPTPSAMPTPRPRVATIAPPSTVVEAAPVIAGTRTRDDRILLEVGPMLSPVSAGVEANLMFPLSDAWRVGGLGAFNRPFLGNTNGFIYVIGGELRYVGSGTRRHFDGGIVGGYATAMGEPVTFAGLRFGWTWERKTTALQFSIAPVAVFTGSDGDPVVPGIWTSLRWMIPL